MTLSPTSMQTTRSSLQGYYTTILALLRGKHVRYTRRCYKEASIRTGWTSPYRCSRASRSDSSTLLFKPLKKSSIRFTYNWNHSASNTKIEAVLWDSLVILGDTLCHFVEACFRAFRGGRKNWTDPAIHCPHFGDFAQYVLLSHMFFHYFTVLRPLLVGRMLSNRALSRFKRMRGRFRSNGRELFSCVYLAFWLSDTSDRSSLQEAAFHPDSDHKAWVIIPELRFRDFPTNCRAILVKVTSLGLMGKSEVGTMLQIFWPPDQPDTICHFKGIFDWGKTGTRVLQEDTRSGEMLRTTYHRHP